MNYADIINQLIKYGKFSGDKNYTPGCSGNISARYGENIIITKSGTSNGSLKEEDFVVIDFAGNIISGTGKASSEKYLHIEFYKIRPDINCIFHVHSPALSAFASCGMDLTEPIMPENIFYFGGIPLAEYACPGTRDLVEKTSVFFENFDAVLMANHGVIIGANNIAEAFTKLELAESYAQTIINCKILGGAKLLTKQQVDEIIALKV